MDRLTGKLELHDLDNDGLLDLMQFWPENQQKAFWSFSGTDRRGFGLPLESEIGVKKPWYSLVDLNGDGKLDLLTSAPLSPSLCAERSATGIYCSVTDWMF